METKNCYVGWRRLRVQVSPCIKLLRYLDSLDEPTTHHYGALCSLSVASVCKLTICIFLLGPFTHRKSFFLTHNPSSRFLSRSERVLFSSDIVMLAVYAVEFTFFWQCTAEHWQCVRWQCSTVQLVIRQEPKFSATVQVVFLVLSAIECSALSFAPLVALPGNLGLDVWKTPSCPYSFIYCARIVRMKRGTFWAVAVLYPEVGPVGPC